MISKRVVISDYISFRAQTRGFEREDIESIVKFSEERYFDVETRRMVAIGRCKDKLVIIPYDEAADAITPVTIHAITRQQIRFRLNTERFVHE